MDISYSMKRFVHKNFPALTHSDYRNFWFGQCVSLIGTWMQNVGQSWLVYSITDSPFLTGLVGTVQFLPVTILSLFAGVIIDKLPKRKILFITQSIAMVLALALSALVFTSTVEYWHVLIIAFLLGCSNAIDMPTRQTYMIEIVGREDLMNAIALNSMVFNLARILGPSIGGLLLANAGIGWCFLINGLSFVAVIYGLSRIKSRPFIRKSAADSNMISEIKDGLLYIKKEKKLIKTLMIVTVMGIFVFNFNVLIPVFTKEVLHMDGKAYGFLMSSLGVGSLIGALTASIKGKAGPKSIVMIGSSMIIALMLTLTGLSRSYYLTALLLAVTGIFNIFFSTTANSTLQINSNDQYRSRVMSVYTLVFAGTAPIGNLLSGYLSDWLGAAAAFSICGISVFVFVFLINTILKSRLKPAVKEEVIQID